MRVYEINICPDLSTGTLMTNIAEAVVALDGGDCRIAYAPKKYDGYSRSNYVIGTMFQRKAHIFLGTHIGAEANFSVFNTKKLLADIKKFSPDIVQLHNIHQYFLNLSVLFRGLKKMEVPVVWTFHDCWPYTGVCHHYIAEKCDKWKKSCFDCSYVKKNKRKPWFDLSASQFRKKQRLYGNMQNLTIVTPSKWLAGEVKKSFLAKNSNVHVINNGIDLNAFQYRTSKIRDLYDLNNKFVIISVASHWTVNKGLSDFLKLAKMVDEDTRIVLVGIEELPEKNEKIICLPLISSKEKLAEWYSAADVYCSFSTEETFGMVVAEAMSCGTPAIVYDSTASPEIVEGTLCKVCSPHDIDAVLNALKEIREKGKAFYSDSCVALARERFNKKTNSKKYVDLYHKILKGTI